MTSATLTDNTVLTDDTVLTDNTVLTDDTVLTDKKNIVTNKNAGVDRTSQSVGKSGKDRLIENRPRPSVLATEPSKVGGLRLVLMLLVGVGVAAGGWWLLAANTGKQSIATDDTAKTATDAGRATLGFGSTPADNMPPKQLPGGTVPVELIDRSDMLRLTGTLVADERSSVASNVSGIVAEVLVDRGSIVRKNDVLVQIDPTDAKNKLAEGQAMLGELKARLGLDGDIEHFNPEDQPEVRLAKAAADLAGSNLRRAKEMFAKKVISTEAYDQTQTEFELAAQRYRQSLLLIKQAFQACQTAMTKLAILEKAVADTTIRAPFDGWVAEKLVSVGEQISAGAQSTKVLTLVRIVPLRLSLTVPQHSIGYIHPKQVVRFHVDSYPDRVFTAGVQYIAPVVTSDTRSMVVEAVVPNTDGALRPGLFATAELQLAKKGAETVVPASAVQRVGEVARVFVVREGVVREQVVALGETENGKVQIKAGLSGKERLVARPELVRDGDVVRP